MIPKIIHYCWFSKNNKPIPEKNQQFIEKWRMLLPDYEFMFWDNSTFDINSTKWTKAAFEVDKFAFISDYVRLYVLYKYGGIYLDTDVELVKDFTPLLGSKFIIGWEGDHLLATSTIGAEKKAQWVLDFLDYYKDREFAINDESLVANTVIFYNIIKEKYPSFLKNILAFDYLVGMRFDGIDGRTKNTYTIHHFNNSWMPLKVRLISRLKRYLWKNTFFRSIYSWYSS